jgi:hypothetical protein
MLFLSYESKMWNLKYHNRSWVLQPVNKITIVFFLLPLQLQVHVHDYIVVKDIVVPRGIMVLRL